MTDQEELSAVRRWVRAKGEGADLGAELAGDHDAARLVTGDVQRASGSDLTGRQWEHGGGGGGQLDLGGGTVAGQAQEPTVVTCSGGVRLPSLGGGNRG